MEVFLCVCGRKNGYLGQGYAGIYLSQGLVCGKELISGSLVNW